MMNTHPHRALQTTSGKTFYAHPAELYSYWFAPAHGTQHAVIKVRCTRATMDAFRKSHEGRDKERFADVLSIGNGWYEITSKDMAEWNNWFGTNACGAKMWLKAFNLAHMKDVDANPKFNVQRVRKIDANKVLTNRPVFMPTPEEMRNRERLGVKLDKLVDRFGRKGR